MKIETNAIVNYNVKNVVVLNLMLTKSQDKLLITAPYQWLDENNKIIKSGCNIYKETDLAVFGDSVIAILKSIIPTTGKNGNCNILLKDVITVRRGYMGDVKWESEILTEAQFLAAVSPLTKQNIIDMISNFTSNIFA